MRGVIKKLCLPLAIFMSLKIFAADLPPPLFQIPLNLSGKVDLKSDCKKLKLSVEWRKNNFPLKNGHLKEKLITVSDTYQTRFDTKSLDSHLRKSFLIDFDELIVKVVKSGLKLEAQSQFVKEVETLVSANVEFASAPMKPASQVLKDGKADCKGHATVATALSRSLKRPARVVGGFVILKKKEMFEAAGHAWSEIYINNVWAVADSALLKFSGKKYYIPLFELKDETTKFSTALYAESAKWVDRIKIESCDR